MRTHRAIPRVLASITFLALSTYAYAKCMNAAYSVTGGVYDAYAMTSLPGVQVTAFLDDSDEASLSTDRASGKELPVSTDSRGRFSAFFWVSTSSGSFFGLDSCHHRLSRITLILSAPGHVTTRTSFKTASLTKQTADGYLVTLPPVPLRPVAYHEPLHLEPERSEEHRAP